MAAASRKSRSALSPLPPPASLLAPPPSFTALPLRHVSTSRVDSTFLAPAEKARGLSPEA
ncbi:hypothetical protein glysoja_022428 [Glycine soja]|nr:hypothetical protein glysoja_022428 [Glycine soja]